MDVITRAHVLKKVDREMLEGGRAMKRLRVTKTVGVNSMGQNVSESKFKYDLRLA